MNGQRYCHSSYTLSSSHHLCRLLFFSLLLLSAAVVAADDGDVSRVGYWTWISGNASSDSIVDVAGVYGTKGVESDDVYPGGRGGHAMAWVGNDTLYVFGGWGSDINGQVGAMNDLWRYRISTGAWTWMSGSTTRNSHGNYSSIGETLPTNEPFAREAHFMSYDRLQHRLVLFGGYFSDTDAMLSDVLQFNLTDNMWTWLAGDPLPVAPVYGTKGQAAPGNTPGGRAWFSDGFDAENNRFFIYSGWLHDWTSPADLWSFDLASNEWTWIAGDVELNVRPAYILNNASATPGSRTEASSLIVYNNSLYLIGGNAGNVPTGESGRRNDVWAFDLLEMRWNWLKGADFSSEPTKVTGTRNVRHVNNTIPPLVIERNVVLDVKRDRILLFGGSAPGLIMHNALWEYDFDTNMWTWLSGSADVDNAPANFGQQGVSRQSNVPASSAQSVPLVIDYNDDDDGGANLYAFGHGQRGNTLWHLALSSSAPADHHTGPLEVPADERAPLLAHELFTFERVDKDTNDPRNGFGFGATLGYLGEHQMLVAIPGVGGQSKITDTAFLLPLGNATGPNNNTGELLPFAAPTFALGAIPIYSVGGVLRNGQFVFGTGLSTTANSIGMSATCTSEWFALEFNATHPQQGSTWQALGSHHVGDGGQPLSAACAAVVDGDMFVLGGKCGNFQLPFEPAPFTRVDGDTKAFSSLPSPDRGTAYCAIAQPVNSYWPVKHHRLYATFTGSFMFSENTLGAYDIEFEEWIYTGNAYSGLDPTLFDTTFVAAPRWKLLLQQLWQIERSVGETTETVLRGTGAQRSHFQPQSFPSLSDWDRSSENLEFELYPESGKQLYQPAGSVVVGLYTYVMPMDNADKMLVVPAYHNIRQYSTWFSAVDVHSQLVGDDDGGGGAADILQATTTTGLLSGTRMPIPTSYVDTNGTLGGNEGEEFLLFGASVVSDSERQLTYFVGGKAVNRLSPSIRARTTVYRWNASEPLHSTRLPDLPDPVEWGRSGACALLSADGMRLLVIGGATSNAGLGPTLGVYSNAYQLQLSSSSFSDDDEEWVELAQQLETGVRGASCYTATSADNGKEYAVLVSGLTRGYQTLNTQVGTAPMQILSIAHENDTEPAPLQFADAPFVMLEAPAVARLPRQAPLGQADVYLFGGWTPMVSNSVVIDAALALFTRVPFASRFSEQTGVWQPLHGPSQLSYGGVAFVRQQRFIYVTMGGAQVSVSQWHRQLGFVNNFATHDQYVSIYDAQAQRWVNDSLPYHGSALRHAAFYGSTSPDTVIRVQEDQAFILPQAMTPRNGPSPFQYVDFAPAPPAEPPVPAAPGSRQLEPASHFASASVTLLQFPALDVDGQPLTTTMPPIVFWSTPILFFNNNGSGGALYTFGGVLDTASATSPAVNWTRHVALNVSPMKRVWRHRTNMTLPRASCRVPGALAAPRERGLAVLYGGYAAPDGGGGTAATDAPTNHVYVYDLQSEQLVLTTEAPTNRAEHFMVGGVADGANILYGGGVVSGGLGSLTSGSHTASVGIATLVGDDGDGVEFREDGPEVIFGPAAAMAAALSSRTRKRVYCTGAAVTMTENSNPFSTTVAVLQIEDVSEPSTWYWYMHPKRVASIAGLFAFVAELDDTPQNITFAMDNVNGWEDVGLMVAFEDSENMRFATTQMAPGSSYPLPNWPAFNNRMIGPSSGSVHYGRVHTERLTPGDSMAQLFVRENVTVTCMPPHRESNFQPDPPHLACQAHGMPYPAVPHSVSANVGGAGGGWTMVDEQAPAPTPTLGGGALRSSIAVLSPSHVLVVGGLAHVDATDLGQGELFTNETALLDARASVQNDTLVWRGAGPVMPRANIGYFACAVPALATVFLYAGVTRATPFASIEAAVDANVSAWYYVDGTDPDVGGAGWLEIAPPCPNPRASGVYACLPRRQLALVFGSTAVDSSREHEIEVLSLNSAWNASWTTQEAGLVVTPTPVLLVNHPAIAESPSGRTFFVAGGALKTQSFSKNSALIYQYSFDEQHWIALDQPAYMLVLSFVGAAFVRHHDDDDDAQFLVVFGPGVQSPSYFSSPYLAYFAPEPDDGGLYYANFTTEFDRPFASGVSEFNPSFAVADDSLLFWLQLSEVGTATFGYVQLWVAPPPTTTPPPPPPTTTPPPPPPTTTPPPPPPMITFGIGVTIMGLVVFFTVLAAVMFAIVFVTAANPATAAAGGGGGGELPYGFDSAGMTTMRHPSSLLSSNDRLMYRRNNNKKKKGL